MYSAPFFSVLYWMNLCIEKYLWFCLKNIRQPLPPFFSHQALPSSGSYMNSLDTVSLALMCAYVILIFWGFCMQGGKNVFFSIWGVYLLTCSVTLNWFFFVLQKVSISLSQTIIEKLFFITDSMHFNHCIKKFGFLSFEHNKLGKFGKWLNIPFWYPPGLSSFSHRIFLSYIFKVRVLLTSQLMWNLKELILVMCIAPLLFVLFKT